MNGDIYAIELPTQFLRLPQIYQSRGEILTQNDSANIIDAMITHVVLSHTHQETIDEQVRSIALMSLFSNFITSSDMNATQSLLNVLTDILVELYRLDTIYSFTTSDVVVSVIGDRVIMKRQKEMM